MRILLAALAVMVLGGCGGAPSVSAVDAGDGTPLAECCAPDSDWSAWSDAGPCPAAIFDLCRAGVDPSAGKATLPSAIAPAGAGGFSCFPTAWCPVDGQPAVIP